MARLPGYDITIELAAGTEIGLMLANVKGRKHWVTQFRENLSPQFVTASVNYASVPANQEIPVAQDEQHAGFGSLYFEDDKRYFESRRVDARFRRKSILGPRVNQMVGATLDSTPIKFVQRGAKFYVAAGECVYQLSTSGSASEVWSGASLDITDMEVLDYVYVALGDDDEFYYSDDMATFTIAPVVQCVATLLAKQQNLLWKTYANNQLSYADDPTANPSDWATAEYFGDTSWGVTAVCTGPNGELVVGKKDGLYKRDSSGNIIQLLKAGFRSAYNYKGMREWNGLLFYPMGNGSFYSFDCVNQPEDISPASFALIVLFSPGE